MELKVLRMCNSDFKVKALEDGSVYLEGWANKATVDRGRDLIGKKAWNVDNYKKNSIMLFNHDHSKPIGKMITVEPRDEGLFVKGRISNSKDPEISRIRDLVKEGILNSLSVGIMVADEEQKDGVNHVRSAELHEVSVVAVPMNQDSQFAVTTKAMQGSMLDSLEIITAGAGYEDVEKACHILHEHEELYTTVDDIAEGIAKASGADKEKSLAFLKMQLDVTPEEISVWLKSCDNLQDDDTNALKKSLEDGMEVQSIKVPKSAVASPEELATWAKESGWSLDNLEETDESYLLVQKPSDVFEGELREVDMGDGVTAMVGKMKVEAEGEAVVEPENKGLLDDQDPMTQPLNGATADDSAVNPSLDQQRQTNVLLSNMVALLQQLNEKIDKMPHVQQASTTVEVKPEDPLIQEDPEEEKLAKQINSFIMKTNERLSQLGL